MATLKDISRESGFSVSTVSYALNNDHRIPEDTRAQIIKVAQKLKYNFRKKSNVGSSYLKQIVFCVSTINGIIYSELYDAIHRVLHLSRCKVLIYCGNNISDIAWVDGFIILNSNVKDEDIREVISRKIPVVLMDRETYIDGASNVTLDNYNGMKELTNRIIAKGAQSFAFISGPHKSNDSNQRFEGYKAALKEHNINPNSQLFYNGDFTIDSGRNIGEALIAQNKKYDAIICANDEMADGIYAAYSDYKIDFSHISIGGFDGIAPRKYVGFITCKYNRNHWGSVAAYTLLQLFEKIKSDQIKILVDVIEY